MGGCVVKINLGHTSRVGDCSKDRTEATALSVIQVAVIKNIWKRVSGILHRIGKQILLR